MPNTQNEQVKTDTSFEENYIDENVSVKTNKTKEFIKKFMKRKTAVAALLRNVLPSAHGSLRTEPCPLCAGSIRL